MADKIAKRGISIYIDGKEVTNSVRGITSEMNKLVAEQKRMTIGSDDYVAHTKKITQLKGVLDQHKKAMNEAAKANKSFADKLTSIRGPIGSVFQIITGAGEALKASGIIGILAGIGTGMMLLVKNSMEFAKAVSELKAITGASGDDLKYLKDQARQLGSEYGKSAAEIVTSMKLVGSAKPELLQNVAALSQMTEAVLILSKASNMSMEETTRNMATIMNQFNLGANEVDRVINTLAAGSKFGAVEVGYLGESISKVGAIMKSAGIELETGVAVMELFGEKGIKAETAGNGFKKVLVELQKDTRNYTNGIFDLNKAIDNNQDIAGDNIKLVKEFGTEFFSLAQILFQNKERFMQLNEQVRGTQTAMEQYLAATDNLSGDIDKLKGAWDAFLLSLENGQGPIANAVRWLVQLSSSAIQGMQFLALSSGQKENQLIAQNVAGRINNFQTRLNSISTHQDRLKEVNAEIIAEKKIYKVKEDRITYLKNEIRWRKDLGGAWDDLNPKRQEELESLTALVNRSKAYVNALAGVRKTLNETAAAPVVTKNTPTTPATTPKTTKDKLKADLDALESNFNIEMSVITNFLSEKLINEQIFQDLSLMNEENLLNAKLDLLRKYKQDTSQLELQLANFRLKQTRAEEKRLGDYNKIREKLSKPIDVTEEDPIIDTTRYTLALRLKILEAFYKKGLITEKEYQDQSAEMVEDHWDKTFKKARKTAEGIEKVSDVSAAIVSNIVDAQTLAVDSKYAAQLKAARKSGQDTTALEEKIEQEKLEIKKKYADLDFGIKIANIVANTAQAVMKMWAEGGILGPGLAILAGTAGATQLAVAYQERQNIKNLWTGGYTTPGGKYEPRGVVHAGEFVASQESVNNRHIKPVLDAIDAAQRTGTASMLTTNHLVRAMRKTSFSDGGFVGDQNNKASEAVMIRLANAIERLNRHIDNGILADVVLSGDKGLSKQIDRYNDLIKNTKRS